MAASLRYTCAVVFVAACALGAGTANAQFRAAIQGAVTDETGGAIPGVTVVVTNQETSTAQETVTNESGFYSVPGLPPGRYRVTASLSGFKETVSENVIVSAEEVRGLSVVLQAGGVQETVTVTAAPPTLRTENADISGTLSTVEIERLPQVGRDPYELVRLTPGVFGLGARSATGDSVRLPNQEGPGGSNASVFQKENQVPVSANGQRVEGNNF
jgi:Carboxypeptidase regulatory-like domain